MPYTLPTLPYAFDALEPHIDARTMEVHYGKHHQTYCDNINKALVGTGWEEKPIEEVLMNVEKFPSEKRAAIRNHGGGYFNHGLFWTFLAPAAGGKPSGDLLEAIEGAFGSYESFQEKFTAAALGQFGSGWAWLVLDQGKPVIVQTANQDSPVSVGQVPLLTVDVWEHAYYLKYQNRRADYVKAWWNVVNWDGVARRFAEAE